MNAYLHRAYAESLGRLGTVRHLPRSGAWILERPIPQTHYRDAMGCYPLFCCQDWSQLRFDLAALRNELVSVCAVTDPFGQYREHDLRESFTDVVRPFKEHYAIDLRRPVGSFVSASHRRNVQLALNRVVVELCEDPSAYLEDWTALYAQLVVRHRISAIPVFSKAAFARQLTVPGIVALRAACDDETVAMSLWFIQGEVAYYHLAASSQLGYELRAGFALIRFAIDKFVGEGLRWINLGAGAGAAIDKVDGLTRFKAGWSTDTRTAYLCGSVLDRRAYAAMVRGRNLKESAYFPAYRDGEFAA